jgi:hypothetical protein
MKIEQFFDIAFFIVTAGSFAFVVFSIRLRTMEKRKKKKANITTKKSECRYAGWCTERPDPYSSSGYCTHHNDLITWGF